MVRDVTLAMNVPLVSTNQFGERCSKPVSVMNFKNNLNLYAELIFYSIDNDSSHST